VTVTRSLSVCAQGDIYKKDYTGHYCVGCEAYLGDDEMEEIDGKKNCCKIHRKPAELRTVRPCVLVCVRACVRACV
jgi:methionyl-tRNA synthetase